MKTPDQLTTALLDETVELMFRIHLMRGECSTAARKLLDKKNRDHTSVEHCARLDEALAGIYKNLQTAVRGIQRSRARKRKQA